MQWITMYPKIRSLLHPVRVIAVTLAIVLSCLEPSGPQAQMDEDIVDRAGPVFDMPAGGPVLEHPPVDNPATLDAVTAERIYASILPQMQAGYAASGDPLAWAYAGWPRLNTVPYRSHRHGNVFVNNYANPIAANYGKQGMTEPLPAGSLIVKDSFIVTETGEIRAGALAIMEKMPPGSDPANGDWRYLVIAPDGALAGVSGDANADPRMRQCAACHNAAPAGQDRLYLVPQRVRR
jgi:hypothetical protein